MSRTVPVAPHLLVALPTLPNFLKAGGVVVDVGTLSDAQARMVAQVWMDAFVAHVRARRAETTLRELGVVLGSET